jgi:hypothetical protein
MLPGDIIILLGVLFMLHHQPDRQVEDTGAVCGKHVKGSKCSAAVHTEVTVSTAQEVTKISLRKSV